MYAIDPWVTYDDYLGYSDDFHDSTYAEAKARLAPYGCTFIKKYSIDALEDFADGSLDFAYIDGNHELKYVVEDLYGWSKKIRPGGMLAGHDYFISRPRPSDTIHVKFAVDAYTSAYRLPQWYVLGTKQRVPGEKRDKYRSFMWLIK
jgi:predicted O-methyltransferase YrrM